MNTANTQKGKGFIITTSKTQTSNKKPVLITKSSIKSNEKRTSKIIIKTTSKQQLNPIQNSASSIIKEKECIDPNMSNKALEIKKQMRMNDIEIIEKDKINVSSLINEEERRNSIKYKELNLKNVALREEYKKLCEIDKEKTLKITLLEQELEKERAEKRKLIEKNISLQKLVIELKEELRKKQLFIAQTMVRQQNEMNEIRNLLNNLRFQAESFPIFFLPFARMFTSSQHNLNLDDMSYEQIINLQDRIGYVNRGLTREQIKKLPKYIQSQQDYNGDICSICYAELAVGEKIKKMTPCSHIYHSKCIKTWLNNEKTCPICKTEIIIPN